MNGQNFKLVLKAESERSQRDIESISRSRDFPSASAAEQALKNLDSVLLLQGFLNMERKLDIESDSTGTAHYNLGPRIERIQLRLADDLNTFPLALRRLEKMRALSDGTEIDFESLSSHLETLTAEIENQGFSFSELQLENIDFNQQTARAQLRLRISEQRRIDKIIVRGYSDFPKKFLRYYMKLEEGDDFTKEKLEAIEKDFNQLTFAGQSRSPEVLFTPDSTIVYLYAKKQKANSFDGILGFASNEDDEGISFNGYLDLSLNNIFNSGESLSLFWKSNGNERQRFYLNGIFPFIFNSPISPTVNFELYRQDSTFNNVRFTLDLAYQLSRQGSLSANFRTENSNDLTEAGAEDLSAYNNWFAGLGYAHQLRQNDALFPLRFGLNFSGAYGRRKTQSTEQDQSRFELQTEYLYSFNQKHHLFGQNFSGWLSSDDYLINELFRVGGIQNLRGFNEESLFVSGYSIFNLEYRFSPNRQSYFFSITDFAWLDDRISELSETALSFGLGYAFRTSFGLLNLSYANGSLGGDNFSFENSKIHVKILSFF